MNKSLLAIIVLIIIVILGIVVFGKRAEAPKYENVDTIISTSSPDSKIQNQNNKGSTTTNIAPTNKEKADNDSPDKVTSAEITYTSQGFSPTSLKIKKGNTVIFRNKSEKSFWPASAIHPFHTIYPEFDSRKPIESEGIYSIVFERAGSWQYHDHLSSKRTGVVIVEN